MSGFRLYGKLLRLFPRRVRARYGAELEEVAESLVEDWRGKHGRPGAFWAWLVLLTDLARTLPAEWLDELRVVRRFRRSWVQDAEPSMSGDGAGPGSGGGGGRKRRRRKLAVDALSREIRHGGRRLLRSPGFAVAAVLMLALGIGSSTAVFSVVNGVLLKPLPYPEQDRLVVLSETRGDSEISVSVPDLLDWRERTRTLDGPAGYRGGSFTLTDAGDAERISGHYVTSDLFGLLGVEPVVGRGIPAAGDSPGAARVVVIGHALWERRLGGDPGVIGRTMRLNSEPYEIIGVMPPGFDFPGGLVYGPAELWVPFGLVADEMTERNSHPGVYAVGRLRDGIGLAAARSDMEGIAARLRSEYPASNERIGVRVRAALDEFVGPVRATLFGLLGAVGLILLIVCANVANLLVVRATARRREMGVRAALGASRGDMLASSLVESLFIGATGGALGVVLASWMTGAGRALLRDLPRADLVTIDARVLGFSASATLLAVLLFGLLPALREVGSRSSAWLHSRGEDRGTLQLRAGLVIAEIALSLAVLIGAGLLIRSFVQLQARDPGIDPQGAVAFRLRLPEAEYEEGAPVRAFYDELFERLEGLPGVVASGGISTLPFSGSGSQSSFSPSDRPELEPLRSDVAVVTPGYFASLGIDRIRGRLFDRTDGADSRPVVVVDERFARRLWPESDPIGQRVTGWGLHDAEVIGVVGHVANYGVASESREEVYMPHAQRSYYAMWVTVRASTNLETVVAAIRRTVASLDPAIPVQDMISMPGLVMGRVAAPRLTATLGGGFAILALVLSGLGLYGLIAYSVARRTREFGTRIALGAESRDVVAMVVRQGVTLALAGIAIGLPLALGAARLLRSQIHDVSATDPATFVLPPVGMLGLALVAAWVPALRATRISPVEALRE